MDDSSGVATGKRGAEELESAENGIFVGDGGGGGDASAALPAAAPKQLRKKSVSFTGEETYQMLRDELSRPTPQQALQTPGLPSEFPPQMSGASTSSFFLRSNRSTSPMVTPHAAYAARGKNIFPVTEVIPEHVSTVSRSAGFANGSSRGSGGFAAAAGGNGSMAGRSELGWHRGNSLAATSYPAGYDARGLGDDARVQPTALGQQARQLGGYVENGYGVLTGRASSSDMWKRGSLPARGINRIADGASSVVNSQDSVHGAGRRGGAEIGAISGAKRRRPEDDPSMPTRRHPAGSMVGYDNNAGIRGPNLEGGLRDFRTGGGDPSRTGASRYVAIDDDLADGAEARGARRGRGGGGGFGIPQAEEAKFGGVDSPSLAPSSVFAQYEDVIDGEVDDDGEGDEEEEGDEEDELQGYGGNRGQDQNAAGDDEESPYFSDDACAIGDDAIYSHGLPSRGRWQVNPQDDAAAGRRSHGRRDKWEVGTRYEYIRTLGHGSYGEVAQARDLQEGVNVAIKRVINVFDSEVDAKRIYREMYILRHLRHDEIIRLRDVILPPSFEQFRDLYLVFEFVDTDLYKVIGSPQYLTDEHIKLFLYQMLIGLKYVHSAHVIHRDMKPANILLNEDCTLKICDFGLSRVVTQDSPAETAPPSRHARAPQHRMASVGEVHPDGPETTDYTGSAVKQAHQPRGQVGARGIGGGSVSVAGTGGETHVNVGGDGAGARAHEGKNGKAGPERSGKRGAAGGEDEGGKDFDDEPPQGPRTLKRQLTKHVVTRWYRAPELILLQDYNKAVDVWSLGCILAELLSMQEASFANPQERNALFPGKSCFPLSADQPSTYSDALDQLNVIFDVIGTPSEEDIAGLGDVRQYLARLSVKKPVNLKERYRGASDQALELLSAMLRFNPARRVTVDEAIEHPYLSSCRKRDREVTAAVPINMEFENIATNRAALKRLVYEEVLHYHSTRPTGILVQGSTSELVPVHTSASGRGVVSSGGR